MTLRCFDSRGRPLSREDLGRMNVLTPVMEHILATVVQRVSGETENAANPPPPIEGRPSL